MTWIKILYYVFRNLSIRPMISTFISYWPQIADARESRYSDLRFIISTSVRKKLQSKNEWKSSRGICSGKVIAYNL